jgi:plastocyanin
MRNVSHVVLGLLVAFVMACSGGGDGTGPDDNGDDDGNGNGNGSGSVAAEITMDQTAFIDPDGDRNQNATVTIQVGETVRWTNNDDVAHTVDSGEGSFGDDGDGVPDGATDVLASGNLSPGQTYEFTFGTAGTWTYYCQLHPGTMINATVIVQE